MNSICSVDMPFDTADDADQIRALVVRRHEIDQFCGPTRRFKCRDEDQRAVDVPACDPFRWSFGAMSQRPCSGFQGERQSTRWSRNAASKANRSNRCVRRERQIRNR